MPSWNIHTAHVEQLLAEHPARELGIADANIFLFGNYAPDIYVGFMVPDATYRIDYCLTHNAVPHVIPTPDADRFWDECICHPTRKPKSGNVLSITLGAWAHLVADRTYNQRFRMFCETHDTPAGDELRQRKQSDFDKFGCALGISSKVTTTPELLDAAMRFRPYSILPDDVKRTADAAKRIVEEAGTQHGMRDYQLLSPAWLTATFNSCHEQVASWLLAWQQLAQDGQEPSSEAIRRRISETGE